MFEELLKISCFSVDAEKRQQAAKALEYRYNCEIHCTELAPDVRFAHHARGCIVVAAKICSGVVIFQNVTIGSNMRYNKATRKWENIGSPIIAENTIICDGAKILGPIIIGANSLVAAGAIITRNIPANSIAYGVNLFRPKDENYDFVYNDNLPEADDITSMDKLLIEEFNKQQG